MTENNAAQAIREAIRAAGYRDHPTNIERKRVDAILLAVEPLLSTLRAEGVQAGAPILPSDALDALRDFKLTVIQDGFHKIGKPMIQQLAQAGALESLGFGKHRVTEYGEWLLSSISAALASAPVAGEALNDLQALQWAEKHGLQWALKHPDGIREVIADAQRFAAPQASAEWVLFENEDGRMAAAPSADSATFTANEPAWHRFGPVTLMAGAPHANVPVGGEACVPPGYSVKTVEGHGYRITSPTGSDWVAHCDTPAGDLIAALLAAPPTNN